MSDTGYFKERIVFKLLNKSITGDLPIEIEMITADTQITSHVSFIPEWKNIYYGPLILELNLAGIFVTDVVKKQYSEGFDVLELKLTDRTSLIVGEGIVVLEKPEKTFSIE